MMFGQPVQKSFRNRSNDGRGVFAENLKIGCHVSILLYHNVVMHVILKQWLSCCGTTKLFYARSFVVVVAVFG